MTLDLDVIAEVLPLDDVKRQLHVDGSDDDLLIEQMIETAVETIQGETGHLFGQRSVTERFESFDAIRLRAWPIAALTGIDYFDTNGDPTILSTEQVRLADSKRPARLVLLGGATWPATSVAPDAVGVTFQAGYPPEDVPRRLRTAAMLMIGDLYGQRETWTQGTAMAVPMSLTVSTLIEPFRVYSL